MELDSYISSLPAPLSGEDFTKLRDGIWEHDDIAVYINERKDYAFLFPAPEIDYDKYVSRVAKLGLTKDPNRFRARFDKCSPWLSKARTILEVGAWEGDFIRLMQSQLSDVDISCVEPDQATLASRQQIDGLTDYISLDAAIAAGGRYDVICHFHVFEHILQPAEFLDQCKQLLAPDGVMIAEIPAMSDPLVALYKQADYIDFFFQAQHPFYYRDSSFGRVLAHNGLKIHEMLPHQRYGIDNHLAWMNSGKPGGDDELAEVFAETDSHYRQDLEQRGITDAVIAVVGLA